MTTPRYILSNEAKRHARDVLDIADLPAYPARNIARSLDRVTFVPSLAPDAAAHLWQRAILAGSTQRNIRGITLRYDVHLRSPKDLLDWPLLIHELTHVLQFDRRGAARFLSGYVGGYYRNRLAGKTAHQAYRDLKEEAEARLVEEVAASTEPPPAPWLLAVA